MENMVETLSGTVEKITYRNQDNAYTVAEIKSDTEKITVVGILPFLTEGDLAEFYGRFITHPTYGRQFSAQSFERRVEQNAAAILRYLSAGAIKGIGPATAAKIVERFGNDTLDIIADSPKSLTVIKGISLQKAMDISEEYRKQFGIRDVMLLLSKYKVTPDSCLKIYRKFGQKAKDIIKANPYALCEEGIDFSFESVEEIAFDFKIGRDSDLRISAGIEYVLKRNLLNGHTCLPRKKLLRVASELLGCSESRADICCDLLTDSFRLTREVISGEEFISVPEYSAAEKQIAARMLSVSRQLEKFDKIDDLEIQNIENRLSIKFEALQREAITEAFKSGVLILTGGPGTGKTTTLNAIISLFESRDMRISLAAPTGRAAKRMTELTGREAKTIHRLLEVEWSEGEKRTFARNEKDPLDCDVLIVDEASMIDCLLFNDLLKALRLSTRIILVGDSDQLPSIGAGNILADLLATKRFPAIRLSKIFRQSEKSLIVLNAHAIINDRPARFSEKDSDCFFLRRSDRSSAVSTCLELADTRLPEAYGIDPLKDIQVLCPSRMTDTGSVNLNNLLQASLNPRRSKEPQLSYKGIYFRVGDKVMQIKNNYDLQFVKDNGEYGSGIFNGDVGFITEIDLRASVIKVRFEDRVATYFSEDINQLELAYAITVHKSQGSEFDYVILPLFEVPSKLQYRNLLYTAVTRAKKMLVVVGDETIWNQMAANNRKTLRYTGLAHYIERQAENNAFSLS